MRIEVPEHVERIIATLERAGFEAYAVGGCVRDTILHREPGDWDITTSARPEQVKALFRRTVDTGIEHGTVTIMMEHDGYEVTTYRLDGKYLDGRHPENVIFTASLEEDLKRRDFTINAMAYSHKTGIIDLFGGMEDLEKGVIRCVGSAHERFTEDALRILRALRFSAQLGFEIESETEKAIGEMAERLKLISAERIREELTKLLVSAHPDYIRKACELGVSRVILPELDAIMTLEQRNKYHDLTVGEHTLRALASIRPDKVLRWTMLLHDFGKAKCQTVGDDGDIHFYRHAVYSTEIAETVLKRLKFDNNTFRDVTLLVKYHDYPFQVSKKGTRKALSIVGADMFPKLLEVCTADSLGKNQTAIDLYLPALSEVQGYLSEILKDGECFCLKDLAVSGKDLIAHGMKPGKEIGAALSKCLEMVLDDPSANTKEQLLAYLGLN